MKPVNTNFNHFSGQNRCKRLHFISIVSKSENSFFPRTNQKLKNEENKVVLKLNFQQLKGLITY